jgi:hypothetical protein
MKKNSIFACLIILTLISCWNPFSTRDAENPSDTEAIWEQPEIPSIALANLERAYENRHLALYLENFTEDFRFVADPYDQNGPNGHLYENWDKTAEENVTSRIFDIYSEEEISLTFSVLEDEPDPVSPSGTATLYRRYELHITHSDIIPPESPANGIATFQMIEQQSGYWYIEQWIDQRLDTTDWGEFKANFR